jgi:1-deoxy-D-xylulose-5-phosphate reductoisomerase
VEAFLSKRIGFTQIAEVNQECLQQIEPHALESIEAVIQSDQLARLCATRVINNLNRTKLSRAN